MSLAEQLHQEWPVILAAPYSFWLMLLGVLVVAVLGAHYWNRREMSAIKAEKASADGLTKLTEKRRDGYKVEADNYRKELEKAKKLDGPSRLAPVVYGNTAIQDAFTRVSSAPLSSFTILGTATDWSEDQRKQVAASKRLQEAGFATVVTSTAPKQTTVTGTVDAADFMHTFEQIQKNKK